ncbi:toxin-antitoxin system TumE family protein [Spirosoma fluviale]|uniref:Uncharacterized protein n=1 Tax=Spirosoma fluviale TaxID=1597977 RepID=A0A286GCB7_9BACT|nr:DUF6516 family protein [Spirosoma fluviale]SOD92759.1 hypothetical protein SAMN06269250_4144 [Spirosoma fluviale]
MTHDLYSFRHIIVASTSFTPSYRPEVTQVRGQLTFSDQSVLHVRENYILASGRIDYAYQWQNATHQLIHRWDNAHPVPQFDTSPHHQHIGFEDNVLPSEPMTLDKVLSFIAGQLDQSTTSD